MFSKIFNHINTFIQVRFLILFKQIKIDGESLYIYRKSIPKILIENPLINENIKELGLYEPSYQSLEKIDNFRNLEELCIRFFQYENLPDVLWNLRKLKKLKLEQCQISNLSENIKELNNLEYLNLSCKIEKLPLGISNLKKLKYLNLKRSYLLENIDKLPDSLEELILSNESLDVNEEILCLRILKKLKIINTPILKIPDNIEDCKKLYHLTIYAHVNNFQLSKQIGTLSKLDCLELSGKGIKEINFEFTNLKNIKEISFYDTSIVTLPDSICECSKLKTLSINDTPLKELPMNIGKLNSLSVLNLDYTNIQKLRRSVSSLKKLEYLTIPESVKISSALQDMEENKLNISYGYNFDEASLDEESSIESFADEFGQINRAKDIWLFE